MKLDQNAKNWIDDRIDNDEALMWNEFIIFMKHLGCDKEIIAKYKTMKETATVLYKKRKKRKLPRMCFITL